MVWVLPGCVMTWWCHDCRAHRSVMHGVMCHGVSWGACDAVQHCTPNSRMPHLVRLLNNVQFRMSLVLSLSIQTPSTAHVAPKSPRWHLNSPGGKLNKLQLHGGTEAEVGSVPTKTPSSSCVNVPSTKQLRHLNKLLCIYTIQIRLCVYAFELHNSDSALCILKPKHLCDSKAPFQVCVCVC